VFQVVAAIAGFSLAGSRRLTARSPDRFWRHFSLIPGVVIEICSALRSHYPAGDGSIAIFRSTAADNGRVGWISANSNLQ